MSLINTLKTDLKDFWRFMQMDIKDLSYLIKRFIYLPPVHTEEEKKARERKLVSIYGGNDGQISLYLGRYITTEDVEKRKEELRGYKFFRD